LNPLNQEKRLFLGLAHHVHFLNVGSFLTTVICAMAFKWEAKDIIWGLWASSLSTGYAMIVIGSLRGVFVGKAGERVTAVVSALFLIPFFTVHFGGFHIGHAVFLMSFFPVNAPLNSGIFPFLSHHLSFMNLNPGTLKFVGNLLFVFQSYWIVVAATFVSRFGDFRKIVARSDGFNFISPYANVIRMHILIFVFAGLNGAHLDRFALYPVLLFYFFPWGALLFGRKKKETDPSGVAVESSVLIKE
jgi:hypothetical protein